MKKLISILVGASVLTACGGSPDSSKNKPDTLVPDGIVVSSSSSTSSEPIDVTKEPLPFYESFSGEGTRHFFSTSYKALNSNPALSFYHATGGFGENYVPDGNTSSWLTANTNTKLRLSNGRFTIGQSQQDNTNTTVPGDSKVIPGEFDLSEPYTISFCVNQASGSGNLEIYVDNNTTGGNNSLHGSGNASRIAQQQAGTLVAGQRFSVSIPNQIQSRQIGTASSFLQFRVSSGGSVVFDDLIIETASKPYVGTVPTCVAEDGIDPPPEVAPATPNVSLVEGDKQITVTWPHSGVGATYEVFYNTTNSRDGAYGLWENPMTGNSVTIIDLVNGQEYWVFVKATNAIGSSEWSVAKSATPVAPISPDLDVSRTFKLFTKPAGENLQGTSFPTGLILDTVVVSDTLNLYNKTGSGLRFRDTGVWNFNASSFADGSTVMVADGEVQTGDLRSYIELPLTAGREVTLTYRLKRTSSNPGKIAFITDTGVVYRSIAFATGDTNTAIFDETFTLPEGHSISSLKLVYSREDSGSGGLDFIALRKFYTGDPTPELDPILVDDGSSSSVASSVSSAASSNVSSVSSDGSSLASSDASSSPSVSSSSAASSQPSSTSGGSSSAAGLTDYYVENFNYQDKAAFLAKVNPFDPTKPMYRVLAGDSRISLGADGLTLNNARLSIGELGTIDSSSTTSNLGQLNLSGSFRILIEFETLTTGGDSANGFHVYLDNNTTSSGNSQHGSNSLIHRIKSADLENGVWESGQITLGTTNSFIQLRADSTTESVIKSIRILK